MRTASRMRQAGMLALASLVVFVVSGCAVAAGAAAGAGAGYIAGHSAGKDAANDHDDKDKD